MIKQIDGIGRLKGPKILFLTSAIKKKNEACLEAWIERFMIIYVSNSIPVEDLGSRRTKKKAGFV